MTHVLISGASIAGPALAYWLDRYGFDVTVIERARGVRSGGYPIDVRGSAIDIVDRMGILPALREATIHTQRMTVVRGDGRFAGGIAVPEVLGESAARDVELPRGELSEMLYALTKDRVDSSATTAVPFPNSLLDRIVNKERLLNQARAHRVAPGPGVTISSAGSTSSWKLHDRHACFGKHESHRR